MARIDQAFLPWMGSQADRVALRDARNALTYGALDDAIDAVCLHLHEAGVRAGDRVMLVAENSVALAVTMLAVSRLRAWSATVNARLSPREIEQILQHSGARRVLYFGAGSLEAEGHGIAHQAERVHWHGIGTFLLGPLHRSVEVEPALPDVAALVYTSGTTGAPKAVMLTHANLLFIGTNSQRMRALQPTDVIYGVLPLSHVYGLSALLLASLVSGAELLLVPRFDPTLLAHALAHEKVTVLHGVPAMYARLVALAAQSPTAVAAPQLRIAQSGGAPLTPRLKADFEKHFGLVLHNGYGMTEAAPSICQTRMDAPRTDCSVGPPIDGVEIRLQGAARHPEQIGELQLRGPNVMAGYYKSPEQTAQTITPDGWLSTGDLARIDADGAVSIVGRSKELIIRSGFNVYPVEVEQVLNAYPDIVQSAVIGRAVDDNEEVLAFIELSAGVVLDRARLQAWLSDNLSPYKIPAKIFVVNNLPAAATGKILKHRLPALALELSQRDQQIDTIARDA